jgi:DNA-binding MarR family transcriptional regulator
MVVLYRNRQISFTELRDGLSLTDGNLASHAEKLFEAGYVETRRVITRSGFEVRYYVTGKGAAAFSAYLAALRSLLENEEMPKGPQTENAPGPSIWEESIN